MGAMASRITSLMIVYSTVYSDADQRKHQSSASLAFVRGIHRGPVNSPHKWPVTRKMSPFDDVIMWYWDAELGLDDDLKIGDRMDHSSSGLWGVFCGYAGWKRPQKIKWYSYDVALNLLHFPIHEVCLNSSIIIHMLTGLRPANERRCYFVTTSLIGWGQTRVSPVSIWSSRRSNFPLFPRQMFELT